MSSIRDTQTFWELLVLWNIPIRSSDCFGFGRSQQESPSEALGVMSFDQLVKWSIFFGNH